LPPDLAAGPHGSRERDEFAIRARRPWTVWSHAVAAVSSMPIRHAEKIKCAFNRAGEHSICVREHELIIVIRQVPRV
jgi:hypothetical protein